MRLFGIVRLKSSIDDFDFWACWRSLVNNGIPPSEAWNMDFIEMSQMVNVEPSASDTSMVLYYQRQQNGAPKECLQRN